jgi:hypothetical protein
MIGKATRDYCSMCDKFKYMAVKSKRLCTSCNNAQKKKSKEKVKPKPKKKSTPIKSNHITQAKLDQMTSWLVRTLYPAQCPHCMVHLDRTNSNCGHFVSRTKQSTRFSLKNLVAIDRTCNFYRPEHAYTLGKYLDKVWGEGTADAQILLGNKKLKLCMDDRRLIYNLYKEILERAEGKSQDEKFELMKEAQLRYEQIVNELIY